MKKRIKEWYEIKEEFENMQNMECHPTELRLLKADYVFDEDKSVKWNREQVEANNLKYKQEVDRLNLKKNKCRDAIYEDIYDAIIDEVGHGISRKKAMKIWDYAYEIGHSFGIVDILSHLYDIMEVAETLLSDEQTNEE